MLRPATPLSVLLIVAFGLLLLSVLSTPIIKAVPLGSFDGYDFGVFGYCKGSACSGIEIGYDTSGLFSSTDNASFDIPTSTRKTLSAILIIHPVAAGLTLVMFILAIIAHLHSPSHSSRYLLLLFMMGLLNFVVCLLAFLIDVLLFVPHMSWGSYIVLTATILVALSGLVACAMRRTIVGRKARKRKIEANAEMSGENFYNRQAQASPPATSGPGAAQPTVPMVSGANGTDKLPEFVTFDKKQDPNSDDRIPLTARSPSNTSPNTYANDLATSPTDMPYNGPVGPNVPRRSLSNTPTMRDEYGNPIQPLMDGYGVRRGPSQERMRGGRGGMPPPGPYGPRGRGGYGGPGRGGYGTPPPRGGYGPQGRGGYGPPPRGGYGPPPRGYGSMRGGRPPPPGYQGSPGPYDRQGSPYGAGPQGPPGPYGARGPSPGPPSAPGYNMSNLNPSMPSMSGASTGSEGYEAYKPEAYNPEANLPRAESPPPLPGVDDGGIPGQAVEMDATTGSPAHAPQGFGQFGIRDSDADIAGMLAMQQGNLQQQGRTTPGRHDTYMSEASRYSQDESQYVPPRQVWNQGPGGNAPRMPSPLNVNAPARVPTAELPSSRSPAPQAPPPAPAASEYYEDVDPRFAAPQQEPPVRVHKTPPPPIQSETTDSYEDIPQGARSPAESERSTFTSISQRGVNPRWNPGPAPPPGYGGGPIPRRPVNRPQEVLLNSNPDFELPTRGSPSRGGGAGGGMIPGSAYPAI